MTRAVNCAISATAICCRRRVAGNAIAIDPLAMPAAIQSARKFSMKNTGATIVNGTPDGRRRANDVDALACFRFRTALERRRHGEDGIDATGGALETSLIVEVPGNDRDPTRREGRGGGGLWLPRERANRVPAGEQLAHQMAALLPGRAGHEHVQLAGHVAPPFMTCLQQTASQVVFAASATGTGFSFLPDVDTDGFGHLRNLCEIPLDDLECVLR